MTLRPIQKGAPKEAPAREVQLVIFRLATEEFGVEVVNVKEIIKLMPITRIPRAPHFLEGVINLRGQITAVVDLRKRFSVETKAPDDNTRIIVLVFGDVSVGVIVDAVYEVLRIPEKDIEPPPPVLGEGTESHYVKGVGKVGDRLILLLDAPGLFTRREVDTVDSIEHKKAPA